ncbi:hypothetical protein HYW36_02575 [Candidatus Saccharibacteria bacterium]|nr:hypothetical protein [Candidatus Saccharibacteria bacterium]
MTRYAVSRERRSDLLNEHKRADLPSRAAVRLVLERVRDWWNTSVPESRAQLVAATSGRLALAGEVEPDENYPPSLYSLS